MVIHWYVNTHLWLGEGRIVLRQRCMAALTSSTSPWNRLLENTREGTPQDSDERFSSAQKSGTGSLRSKSRVSTLHTQHHRHDSSPCVLSVRVLNTARPPDEQVPPDRTWPSLEKHSQYRSRLRLEGARMPEERSRRFEPSLVSRAVGIRT